MHTIWLSTAWKSAEVPFVSTTASCRCKCLNSSFTQEAAQEQFGFLMNAFEYGAPPHGGLAFGLDRLCQILGMKAGLDYNSIRDYIAFPKNNQGRDTMINSPSQIDARQMEELRLQSTHNTAQGDNAQ